jgi:hypothetical protein
MSQKINSFVATLDELLRFLESYKEDVFYFDINPSIPPEGARVFDITTFPPEFAYQILEDIHPYPSLPRMTPAARQLIESAAPPTVGVIECGMNIHPKNGQGYPIPTPDFQKFAWVRFPINISPAHFPSLDAGFAFYDIVVSTFNSLGVNILLVMTHEMYGEGSGFNFGNMNTQQWASFTASFVTVAEKVIRRYGNRIQAYEVWNEGDAEVGNPAAVHIPPRDYAPLLDQVSKLVRTYAPDSKVIVGGLVRGPEIGKQYILEIKSALKGRLPVDAIGVHPYGKGSPQDATIFSRYGNIADDIKIFGQAAPDVPLWLTEVGAMGTDDPAYWDDAAIYMKNLYTYLRQNQANRTPVVIWYAWSDAMDMAQRTNGLVRVDGSKKPYLYDTFFSEACK